MNSMKLTISAFALLGLLAAPAAAQRPSCDEKCLTGIAEDYMEALLAQDYTDLPWGKAVGYTENGVGIMIGESLWGAIRGVQDNAFIAADPTSGNVVWLGVVEEHDLPAYYGMRLKVEDRKITEVEAILGREGAPGTFTSADGYRLDRMFSQRVPERARAKRERLVAIVEGYFNTKQLNDGTLYTEFADDCNRVINGVSTTEGEDSWAAQLAKGCQHQMEIGLYKPVDRVRERRFPVVDEERGIVIATSMEDHAVRYVTYKTTDGEDRNVEIEYPNTLGLIEAFKIVDGEIVRIEGFSAFLPYYMRTRWGN